MDNLERMKNNPISLRPADESDPVVTKIPFIGGVCCLIREVDGKRQHGFLFKGSWTMNLGNIFSGGNSEYIEYNSEEEIFEDGWQVD